MIEHSSSRSLVRTDDSRRAPRAASNEVESGEEEKRAQEIAGEERSGNLCNTRWEHSVTSRKISERVEALQGRDF